MFLEIKEKPKRSRTAQDLDIMQVEIPIWRGKAAPICVSV